jgi:hypothetical protein
MKPSPRRCSRSVSESSSRWLRSAVRSVTYFSSALSTSTSATGTRSTRPRSLTTSTGTSASGAGGCPPASAAAPRAATPPAGGTQHRLGQVVHRVELEGAQRMLAVRGDEHHRRRVRQRAQRRGQLQAVAAGHADVQQHQVAASAASHVQRRLASCASATTCTGGSWILPAGCAGAGGPAARRRRSACAAVGGWQGHDAGVEALGLAPGVALAATSCSRRRRSRTLCSAMPWPGGDGSGPTVLCTVSTAWPRRATASMWMRAAVGAGSTPWRTAFSTSGCSTSGGTRARPTRGSSAQPPAAGRRNAPARWPGRRCASATSSSSDTDTPVSASATRNSSRQVFQHRLGLGRVDPHQGQRGVQRVEQEVRPDARLQLGQPHAGGGRLPDARPQVQPGPQQAGETGAGQRHAQRAARRHRPARPATAATRPPAPSTRPGPAPRCPQPGGAPAQPGPQRTQQHQPGAGAGSPAKAPAPWRAASRRRAGRAQQPRPAPPAPAAPRAGPAPGGRRRTRPRLRLARARSSARGSKRLRGAAELRRDAGSGHRLAGRRGGGEVVRVGARSAMGRQGGIR